MGCPCWFGTNENSLCFSGYKNHEKTQRDAPKDPADFFSKMSAFFPGSWEILVPGGAGGSSLGDLKGGTGMISWVWCKRNSELNSCDKAANHPLVS